MKQKGNNKMSEKQSTIELGKIIEASGQLSVDERRARFMGELANKLSSYKDPEIDEIIYELAA